MHRIICIASVVLLGWSAVAGAEDWNAFLGPHGNGISDEQQAPTTWGPQENIRWRAKLPRECNGSPIVSRGRVFLTCAEDADGTQRSLYCYDGQDGKQLWVRTVRFDKVMPTHKTNPYCATTPAADGKRVVVWHGSAGLFCYGFDGQEHWSRDLGEFEHMWGYAASPVLYGDRVILHCGPGKRVFVTALDLETGESLWETEEPQEGDGQRNDEGNPMGSWSTPVVTRYGGQDLLILSLPTRLVAYHPKTGNIMWYCEGLSGEKGDLAYSSAMISGNLCVSVGGFNGPSIGLRLGGSGDITSSNRLWRTERNPQSIGTGVFLGKHIYRPNAGPGTIQCLDAENGQVLWTDRAAGSVHWASVVHAANLLYATNQEGTTVVFKPNPRQFDLVAVNKLDETTNSTPAISDGEIFIRTFQHLYCIGQ